MSFRNTIAKPLYRRTDRQGQFVIGQRTEAESPIYQPQW